MEMKVIGPGRDVPVPTPTRIHQWIVIDIYFRDESESEEEVTQPFPTTPSSQIEHHISVRRDAGSPDTVILDDDDDAPVVNEKSILKVVSSSQSFHGSDLPALLGKMISFSVTIVLKVTYFSNTTKT